MIWIRTGIRTIIFGFWYEIVGGAGDTGQAWQYGPPLQPGDDVASVVIWRSDNQHTLLSNCDFTSGGCFQIETPILTPAPANSVEWIVEAPLDGGIIQPLAKFDIVSFYNACFVRVFVVGGANTCEPIAAGTRATSVGLFQYVLNAWQRLAQPYNLAGDGASSSFDVLYEQPEHGG